MEVLRRPLAVALIGLGKLGLTVARDVLDRDDLEVVAATDLHPDRLGKDLGELLGRAPLGVVVAEGLPENDRPDAVFLMTGSRMDDLGDTIENLSSQGINVITSAEELVYPWHEFPTWSERLDAAGKQGGASILGAGVNPGFLMDALPILLSAVSRQVERITMRRTMDLRPHRPERLTRFGLGLAPADFSDESRPTIYGHVGFRQSIDAVADALGWPENRVVEEDPPEPAILADEVRQGDFAAIEPGCVAVVRQSARGRFAGETLITLHEHFGFVEADDPIPSGDRLSLDCSDQTFTLEISPGLFSFASTPAVLINLCRPLVEAPPGLISTADLSVRSFSSRGRAPLEPVGG